MIGISQKKYGTLIKKYHYCVRNKNNFGIIRTALSLPYTEAAIINRLHNGNKG